MNLCSLAPNFCVCNVELPPPEIVPERIRVSHDRPIDQQVVVGGVDRRVPGQFCGQSVQRLIRYRIPRDMNRMDGAYQSIANAVLPFLELIVWLSERGRHRPARRESTQDHLEIPRSQLVEKRYVRSFQMSSVILRSGFEERLIAEFSPDVLAESISDQQT